jgi:hypothetical protein
MKNHFITYIRDSAYLRNHCINNICQKDVSIYNIYLITRGPFQLKLVIVQGL